jgi:outer membrane protein assembly factor BamB
VEAASDELIEKVRLAISDSSGQYRILDLRPGTYKVSFKLPGFNTFVRDALVVTTDFVPPVNAELRVGTLEETVTVTSRHAVADAIAGRRMSRL